MTQPGSILSESELIEVLGQKGTVWLDAHDPDARGDSMLFKDPVEEVIALTRQEVLPAFQNLDKWIEKGFYIAGYVSYEAGYAFESELFSDARSSGVRSRRSDTQSAASISTERKVDEAVGGFPLLWFGIYKAPIAVSVASWPQNGSVHELSDVNPPETYVKAVQRIRQLIAEGDVYQINFTTRFRGRLTGTAEGLFGTMRESQPVEYGAFLRTQWGEVVSMSPELFFHFENGHIVARPMKGTAPRGETAEEDLKIKDWLASDPKNRSENLMIVDLLRNDLSVICEPGSVVVPSLFDVRSYPTVHQMSSSVRGRVKEGNGLSDIFKALFPCGSITGAPKLRAMERIAELETQPRGVYCGAIGYAGPERQSAPHMEGAGEKAPEMKAPNIKATGLNAPGLKAVFSVAIRTATIQKSEVTFGAGGGIVWDSVPEEEYEEAVLKTRFVSGLAQSPLQLIETMRCEGGIPWLEYHLDRLEESSRDLGFVCDRGHIRNVILHYVAALDQERAFRIRLLLNRNGSTQLSESGISRLEEPIQIGLSTERVSSGHPYLRYKTTRRAVYDRARAEARARNLYDVLLSNEREEITEGAITNIFARIQGVWYTPPVQSGLLPGVGRRVFMLRHSAVERVLRIQDLRAADALRVTNAVIGEQEAEWRED